MLLQKYKFDYPKKIVHYRGGQYFVRRITFQNKDEPASKRQMILSCNTLDQLLSDDSNSEVDEVKKQAQELHSKIPFFLPDHLFEGPGLVLQDVLQREQVEYDILHVS